MIQPVVLWPDPILDRVSEDVRPDEIVKDIVQDLFDTMYDLKGVGMSAVQIGVLKRILVIDVNRQISMVNPIITDHTGPKVKMNEGCLSIPGIVEEVWRHPSVTAAFTDLRGDAVVQVFTGMEAQAVQHEIDHLNGIVLPSKLGAVARDRIRAKMAKIKRGK